MQEELTNWLRTGDSRTFPYEPVVAALHRVGKHFAPASLLAALGRVRDQLTVGPDPSGRLLQQFLHTALDKAEWRFDNPSYLAIDLLDLPAAGDRDTVAAQRRRDVLLAGLVADLVRFELDAAEGTTELLPQMRPDGRLAAKRCRLGMRALLPALERLGVKTEIAEDGGPQAARELCALVDATLNDDERRTVRLSILPVSQVHDEYMFIRVLQAYETAFSLAAVQLAAAVEALEGGDGAAAARAIRAAETSFREAKPLFSLIGTMLPEAFLTFREFTDGASAIQSRSYKVVESLCRKPDGERVDSPAYESVPEVRARVLAGQANITASLVAARDAGTLTDAEEDAVTEAMGGFEAVLLEWRKTHHRIAMRMLGERRGTGYTAGVPYLDRGRRIPVFGDR
jgi:tryptophan 2,3-dioxygenase